MKRDGRTIDHQTSETIRLMAVERVREGEAPICGHRILRVQPHDDLQMAGGDLETRGSGPRCRGQGRASLPALRDALEKRRARVRLWFG